MPIYERLSLIVSVTLIGIAFYFIVKLPTRTVPLTEQWTLSISSQLIMSILLAGLAFAGARAIVKAHPAPGSGHGPYWVNAVLTVLVSLVVLPRVASPMQWGFGLVFTGVLLWIGLLGEYRLRDTNTALLFVPARLWLQTITYLLLGIVGSLAGQTASNIWMQTLIIFVASGFSAAAILRLNPKNQPHMHWYSLIIGLVSAQLSWVFAVWQISVLGMALVLLAIFHTLVGLITAYHKNRLSARIVLEYSTILVLSMVLISQL